MDNNIEKIKTNLDKIEDKIKYLTTRNCINCIYIDSIGICKNKDSFCYDIDTSSDETFFCSKHLLKNFDTINNGKDFF